jgi:hypothetical protein
MKYHLKEARVEWAIEAANNEAWILKKKDEGDWQTVGTYRSPHEAAVIAGARKRGASPKMLRVTESRRFVLSGWSTAA